MFSVFRYKFLYYSTFWLSAILLFVLFLVLVIGTRDIDTVWDIVIPLFFFLLILSYRPYKYLLRKIKIYKKKKEVAMAGDVLVFFGVIAYIFLFLSPFLVKDASLEILLADLNNGVSGVIAFSLALGAWCLLLIYGFFYLAIRVPKKMSWLVLFLFLIMVILAYSTIDSFVYLFIENDYLSFVFGVSSLYLFGNYFYSRYRKDYIKN